MSNDATSGPEISQRVSARPLAGRADFKLGDTTVRPSLLTIEGPVGSARGEPRVMRVLVALADARGGVLSREDFLHICWDDRIVGDDAINRAIAEARRLLTSVEANFEIETVARVGYRLSGVDWIPVAEADPERKRRAGFNRRAVIGGSAVALAGFAGAGFWLQSNLRRSDAIDALVERGRTLQASGAPDDARDAAALFRQAIERDPSRADAWGWLATVTADSDAALGAADRALSLDPGEPNARTVVASQRFDLDNWVSYEDALLGVLRDAPETAQALSELTLFYQGMGRCRDSLAMNERVIRAEPFNPAHQARQAMKHWIFGDVGACDRVANRSLQLWPRSATVWNARMVTLAYTDRAPAARALLANLGLRPREFSPVSLSAWSTIIAAIATRAPSDMARVVAVNTSAATQSPGLAANAIMAFSHLGLIDEAFEVANGLLTQSGAIVQRTGPGHAPDMYSRAAWARTQFLFVPACQAFRKDSRFPELCRRVGHVAYWRQRGIWPDRFVRGAIEPARLV